MAYFHPTSKNSGTSKYTRDNYTVFLRNQHHFIGIPKNFQISFNIPNKSIKCVVLDSFSSLEFSKRHFRRKISRVNVKLRGNVHYELIRNASVEKVDLIFMSLDYC